VVEVGNMLLLLSRFA